LVIYYLDIEIIENIRRKLNLPASETSYNYKGGIEFVLYHVKDVYEELPEREAIIGKAAYLLHSISSSQYFVCGNKRTGFLVACTFLNINNMHFNTSEEQKYLISRAVASPAYNIDNVRQILRQNLI